MYFGDFSSREDVCEGFAIHDFDGEILVAVYDTRDYEGNAEVIFVHGGRLFYVSGSHCSCYGLEDQWEPEEMDLASLVHIVREGKNSLTPYRDEIETCLRVVTDICPVDAKPEHVALVARLAFSK